MKKLRLAAAAALVMGAGVQAALTNTITVNTIDDQDGEILTECSLREAIKAVNTHAPYGGCPAGHPFNENLIQLEGEKYILDQGQLIVSAEVIISGKDRLKEDHDDQINPLTGEKPLPVRPDYDDPAESGSLASGTTITAAVDPSGGSRIFFSTASMSVTDIELVGSDANGGAVSGNGGIIYSAGSLALTNVILRDGRVTGSGSNAGNGGAIYLAGDGTSLSLKSVTLESNAAANTGGAVAMLCSVDLSPYAQHTLSVAGSIFKDNSATMGAGAIDICGTTTASLVATTLSGNTSLMWSDSNIPDSGAIAYVQAGNPEVGQLLLTNVTAAEQNGHVLALQGLGNVAIKGSLLAFGNTSAVCFNPDLDPDTDSGSDTDAPMTSAIGSGQYNAVTAGGSCDPVLARPASGDTNKDIPVATALTSVLTTLKEGAQFTDTGPFGLTEYYLPSESTPTFVIDQGGAFANCTDADQRGLERKSGAFCDIGAVERRQLFATNDEGMNSANTNRVAIIDVLANDHFGEGDDHPYKFVDFAEDDTGTAGVNEGRPVEIVDGTDDDGGICKWEERELEDGTMAGRVVVTSPGGALRDLTNPIECTYRVHDTRPGSSNTATISVTISNMPPNAKNDVYVRPVGVGSISFDPLENDDDSGDGKYGNEGPLMQVPPGDPTQCQPDPDDPGGCLYSDTPNWIDIHPPIEITQHPQLGRIESSRADVCSGRVTSTCLTPPLRYIADNSLAPFTDSFSYRVYDEDGTASNSAIVTITTDAPDIEHGGGSGSLDLLGGLILGLLGLRRLFRL
ncbi:MAG: hypothetical protein K0R03_1829 [Moraxellaceae bacterium]|jgi:CSLREA domain-containing protein|nr:hypothetical protein [Moraxellaceae bacterium]